jgi:hypothetical protein
MKSHQRGFIPLVAIILLGITAVVGGTIATVSIRNSNPKPSSEVGIKAEEPALAPVSARVESSEAGAKAGTSKPVSSNVEARKKTESAETSSALRDSTRKTCATAQEQDDLTGKGLITNIHALCDQLLKGNYTSENIQDKEADLQEKWRLWKVARVEYRTNEFEAKGQTNEDSTGSHNNQVPTTPQPDPEGYSESSTYPIILAFTDNFGNIKKSSDYNGYRGSYSTTNKATLHVGDTIKVVVEAKDPKGRSLEYNWNASSQYFNDAVGRGKYTTSNTLTYTLTADDLKSAGETFRLAYQVRVVGTDYYRFGGGKYDDAGFIDYSLQP